MIAGSVALLLAGFIANACVTWYSISSREGASGFFVVGIALAGGLLGAVLGMIVARSIAMSVGPNFFRELLAALGLVVLLAGVSALLCRFLADIPPRLDGHELNLQVEFRFPNTRASTQAPTQDGDWQFVLSSLAGQTQRAYNEGTVRSSEARWENGHWIVPATVSLFTERGRRSVSLGLRQATETTGFLLPLPARPDSSYQQWSEWLPLQQANGQAWPADRMSCRFRIQKVAPPSNADQ